MSRTDRDRTWAVRMPRAGATAAGRLRAVAGIEACLAGEDLWLHGSEHGEDLEKSLRMLPGAERFLVAADGQLRPIPGSVPRGRLPDGPWVPLAEWFRLELPVAGLGGRMSRRARLTLVRCFKPEEANLLVVGIEQWEDYAVMAPQVRLDRWQFAAAADKRVLVRGEPLPPLPGRHWIERQGIAVPAGWTWSPPVEPAVVRRLLSLEGDDIALLHPDGTWERVPGGSFCRACRSAARRTAEELCHD